MLRQREDPSLRIDLNDLSRMDQKRKLRRKVDNNNKAELSHGGGCLAASMARCGSATTLSILSPVGDWD
jgi:hypothetical protein